MKRLVLAVLMAFALPAAAGTLSVQWDPVTHPTLTGYRVYSGTATGVYAYSQITTGTQAVVPVPDCVEFWIAVKAEATTTDPDDDDGVMDSVDFSNEVSAWGVPQVVSRHVIKTNKVVQFELRGFNFRPGAELEVTGATVSDVTVVDCQTITATLDPRSAPAGNAMITVMNPDTTFGAANAVTFYQGPTPPPTVTNLRK